MIFTCALYDHCYDSRPEHLELQYVCFCGAPGWREEREWRTSLFGRKKPCVSCGAPTIGRVKTDPMCHACWIGGTLDFASGEPLKSTA